MLLIKNIYICSINYDIMEDKINNEKRLATMEQKIDNLKEDINEVKNAVKDIAQDIKDHVKWEAEKYEKLDSIHIHYVLNAAYAAGQTIVFDVYYTWLMPGQVIPALAGWSQALGVSVVLDAVNPIAQYTYGLAAVVSNFAPPAIEGYGVGMLIRLVRGNGTYTGDLGIVQTDVHALRDRSGSQSEFSDV